MSWKWCRRFVSTSWSRGAAATCVCTRGGDEWHSLFSTRQSLLPSTLNQHSANHGIKYTCKPTFIKRATNTAWYMQCERLWLLELFNERHSTKPDPHAHPSSFFWLTSRADCLLVHFPNVPFSLKTTVDTESVCVCVCVCICSIFYCHTYIYHPCWFSTSSCAMKWLEKVGCFFKVWHKVHCRDFESL